MQRNRARIYVVQVLGIEVVAVGISIQWILICADSRALNNT